MGSNSCPLLLTPSTTSVTNVLVWIGGAFDPEGFVSTQSIEPADLSQGSHHSGAIGCTSTLKSCGGATPRRCSSRRGRKA